MKSKRVLTTFLDGSRHPLADNVGWILAPGAPPGYPHTQMYARNTEYSSFPLCEGVSKDFGGFLKISGGFRRFQGASEDFRGVSVDFRGF